MDVTDVEFLTHHQSVMTSLWEVPKIKKPNTPREVIEEEDIEETTTMTVVLAFGLTGGSYVKPLHVNTVSHAHFKRREDGKVSFTERVKISSTYVRLETTVPQTEETFQVIIDLIKNSKCFKAFTISIDVSKIFMQLFWHTIKKVQGTYSYEFLLANKKCVVSVDVFRMILDICPRVKGVDFTDVPDDDATLAFLIELGYKGRRRDQDVKICHSPNSPRLKFVRIGEDYQQYGLPIPETMLTEAIKQSESYKIFIKYSTGQIPPKKSRGKGSQGKKTTHTHVADVDVSEELDLESPKNIALELNKSISKTEAEEAEAARQVHAMHARIVTKFVLDPTRRRKSGNVTYDPPKRLKGVPSLTPEEQEAVDTMQALKESRKTSRRQHGTEGSNEELEKVISEEKVILEWGSGQESEYSKEYQLDDEEKDDKDDVDAEMEEPKTVEHENKEKDVITDASKTETVEVDVSSLMDIHIQQDTSQIQSPSVHKVPVSVILETTNLLPIPEFLTKTLLSTVVSSPHLRVTKLENDVYELKKIDLSTEAFAALKTQVPSVIDIYLGSKVGDTPTVDLEQKYEKSPLEILKIKKEQAEKKKMSKFTIKSTDKATLKEFDQKSALYQTMHANKSFNRNSIDHRLYHALIEALIEDENAMDKGVADTELESSKKPSTTKETSKGKAPSKGSKTGKFASTKKSVKEPMTEVVMDDAGEDVVHDDDQPQDTSEPKTAKTLNLEWFTQPPRPLNPDSEWNKRQVVLDQPKHPWFNQMVSATMDPPTFNDLMATPIDFSKENIHYFDNEDKSSSGERRKLWHRYQLNKFSKHNVYSTKKILGVRSVSVKKLHGCGHLEKIVVKRANHQLYKFKEGDFVDLHLNNIEDMLLLGVQHKLFHLTDSDIVDFIVALRMFTRSLVIKKRVEDLQMRERRIIQNLERLVGARELEMDYKLMTRTV
nr:hypothetical protein [Tanacetum cinerariifolium]